VSSGENVILLLLPPPWKNILAHTWKIHYWPLEKILPALIFKGTFSSIEMLKGYMDRVSLGNPVIEELN